MHTALIFLVTTLISFAGSLQLGPVNLTVIHATMTRNRRAAMIIGLGGCIPELLYSIPALLASGWIKRNQQLLLIFEWAIVPVLLLLAAITFFRKQKEVVFSEENNLKQHTADFFKGFFIASFNPQLFPYWVTILLLLNGYDFFHIVSVGDQIAFVLGTGLGAFILFAFWSWLAVKYRNFLMKFLGRWNLSHVFAGLYLVLAIYQAVKLTLFT